MSNNRLVPQSNPFTLFSFEDSSVRVITDKNGDLWFVANDVCKILDIANSRDAVTRLDEDEKRDVGIPDTIGRLQQTTVVSESGMYALTFSSRKPEARHFAKYVRTEIIPSIRKTGTFGLENLSPVQLILLQAQRLVDHEERLSKVEAKVHGYEQGDEFMTVLAYCLWKKIEQPSLPRAGVLGKQAVKLSRQQGVKTSKVRDPRFGEINAYHISILDQLFALPSNSL